MKMNSFHFGKRFKCYSILRTQSPNLKYRMYHPHKLKYNVEHSRKPNRLDNYVRNSEDYHGLRYIIMRIYQYIMFILYKYILKNPLPSNIDRYKCLNPSRVHDVRNKRKASKWIIQDERNKSAITVIHQLQKNI